MASQMKTKKDSPYQICDRCGRQFNSGTVQTCKHEAVNNVYGTHICMYCCFKCKYVKRLQYGHVTCGYDGNN